VNSKNCTRKHVPEKKFKKSKDPVIPMDYRGINLLVETRGIYPRVIYKTVALCETTESEFQ